MFFERTLTMYERFKMLLDARGIKATEVAKATGITASTFSDWKAGRYKIKADKLQRLAMYFGVSVDFFIDPNYPNPEEAAKWPAEPLDGVSPASWQEFLNMESERAELEPDYDDLMERIAEPTGDDDEEDKRVALTYLMTVAEKAKADDIFTMARILRRLSNMPVPEEPIILKGGKQ